MLSPAPGTQIEQRIRHGFGLRQNRRTFLDFWSPSHDNPSMALNIERLAQEVERQLTSPHKPRTAPLLFTADIEWKNDEGEDAAFREVQHMLKCSSLKPIPGGWPLSFNHISDQSTARSVDQLSTTPFPDLSLLWKIPARCGHQNLVLDEKGIQQRLKRLHAAKSPGGQALGYSDALWESDEVRSWIASESSSLLMVEGSAALSYCLDDFALKIVESCENAADGTRAVAYLLNPSSIRGFPTQCKYPDSTEVLRQISIQILRQTTSISPRNPWVYLAEAVVAMQNAKTSRDWFQFIGRLSAQFRHVDIVIDVQMLGSKWQKAKSWPQEIKDMFAQPTLAAHISVMLITACPLCVPAPPGETLRLETLTSQRGAARQRLTGNPRYISGGHSPLISPDTFDLPRTSDRQNPDSKSTSNAREAKSEETTLAKSR